MRKLPLSIAFVAAALTACGGTKAGALAPGDPAPDFALPAADGSGFSLTDQLGQGPVLLYFNMAYG